MSARKRNRELALTRALITRAHPNPIADDPNAMRLRSEEELAQQRQGDILVSGNTPEATGLGFLEIDLLVEDIEHRVRQGVSLYVLRMEATSRRCGSDTLWSRRSTLSTRSPTTSLNE